MSDFNYILRQQYNIQLQTNGQTLVKSVHVCQKCSKFSEITRKHEVTLQTGDSLRKSQTYLKSVLKMSLCA